MLQGICEISKENNMRIKHVSKDELIRQKKTITQISKLLLNFYQTQ